MEKIEAKNELESYLYNARNSFRDEKVVDKLGADAKEGDEKAQEFINWLDNHSDEDKESYKNKMKEAEEVLRPILMKLYATQTPAQEQEQPGPKVEEVD